MNFHLGQKVAPPRFVAFVVVFVIGLFLAIPPLGWGRGVMAAFDVAAALFLILIWPLHKRGSPEQMRNAAVTNDANRTVLLGITGVTMVDIFVVVVLVLLC